MPSVKPYRSAPVRLTPSKLATFQATCDPDTGVVRLIRLTGECPRCEDPVEYVLHLQGFGLDAEAGGSAPAGSADAVAAETTDNMDAVREEDVELLREHSPGGSLSRAFNCNCAYPHDPKHGGCGAWFALDIVWEPDDDGQLHATLGASTQPITQFEEDEATAADRLAASELERLRTAAGSWRTGLAALIALVPTLVVVKGTETADKLSGGDRATVGAFVAIGAVLAVGAALLAMRAAFGPLQITSATVDLATARDSESQTTLRYLRWTRYTTIGALIALATAIAWAWQAPTASPAYFSVTKTSGRVVCGTLVSSTKTVIKIKKTDGTSIPVPLTAVKSASFVTGC